MSIGLVAGREVVRLAKVLPRSVALRMAIMGKHERMSAESAPTNSAWSPRWTRTRIC